MVEIQKHGRAHHAAWWSASLAEFHSTDDEDIVERLNLRLVEAHFTARADQLKAWRAMLETLRKASAVLPGEWRLVLEYPLLRLHRRLDAVLVTDRAIFVLEFKSAVVNAAAEAQVLDYALDLRDFHAGSRHHPIVPILVGGTPVRQPPRWPLLWVNADNPVFKASDLTLGALLQDIIIRIEHRGVAISAWETAAYRPVPTIIEAATMLYRKHGVAEIKAARADTSNLSRTTDAILHAMAQARETGAHIIIFVTGIPGAGKTLCGLNAVFSADVEATFLTGTLPMVYVLKAALGLDAETAKAKSKGQANRATKGKIQSITQFLKEYNSERNQSPAEHVIVFDEAQRAWDAAYGALKFQLPDSEAGIVLDIMGAHQDHAVIVALIGNGQEINTGEAGLAEWGRALATRPRWQIRASPAVMTAVEPRQKLFNAAPLNLRFDPALHLDVALRSIQSPAGAAWVDAVLRGAPDEAAAHAKDGVPFFITRSLAALRTALRARAAGLRRAGLVCSSGAKRLVADGLWPKFDHLNEAVVANWFLKSWPDVRASDALEIPATQFAAQGLELDYVGLCWGGDYLWTGRWMARNFVGTKWRNSKQQDTNDFTRNTYRVLLTRARYDTIIWVPAGDPADPTREPDLLDQTAAYLVACGADMLREMPVVSTNQDLNPSLV